MEEAKPISIPMVIGCKLSKEDESPEVNETLYRSMINKLQDVAHNKPDIAQVVGIVARFLANPKESHMVAVKQIF